MSMQPQQFQLAAADGYPLVGHFYPASSANASAIIIVAGTTGVAQRFYRRFALYAANQGFAVVTFDYRGIGLSAPASLRGFQMDYRDWAQQDLQAVIDHLSTAQTGPVASDNAAANSANLDSANRNSADRNSAGLNPQGLPLCLLGHSYGGHALGLINNHQQLSAAYLFGLGAGWHGWMPRAEALKVWLLWHLVAPVLTRWQGYLGWSVLGMGEDLPLGAYQQWKRWCGYRHYFFDDPALPGLTQQFAQVTTPIKAVSALDDKWAPARSRDAFIKHYSASPRSYAEVSAAQLGCRQLGHMGYFRTEAQALWPDVLAYFRQHIETMTAPGER